MMMVVRVTLLFEVIGFGLSIPVMVQVSQVSVGRAVLVGTVAAVLPLLAAAVIKRMVGWVVAWAAQALGIALGLLTWGMFVIGGMFALLFVIAVVLGKRLEANAASGPTPTNAPTAHR